MLLNVPTDLLVTQCLSTFCSLLYYQHLLHTYSCWTVVERCLWSDCAPAQAMPEAWRLRSHGYQAPPSEILPPQHGLHEKYICSPESTRRESKYAQKLESGQGWLLVSFPGSILQLFLKKKQQQYAAANNGSWGGGLGTRLASYSNHIQCYDWYT